MAPLYPWRRLPWSSPRPSDQTGFRPSRSAPRSPLVMLAWNPQVGDLAAQVFRTELFQHGGLAIWNGSWYGGHYTLTYSVLFPPLASLLGPQLVGHGLGGRLLLPLRPPRPRPLGRAGALGDPLVRRRASSRCSPTASSPSPSASPSASPRCAPCRPAGSPWPPRRGRLRALEPGRGGFLAGVPDRRRGLVARLERPLRGWRGLGGAENGGAAPARRPPRVRDGPRGQRSAGRLGAHRPRPDADPQPRLPRRRPVPLRLLLLRRDPALVRLGALRDPRAARGGAAAALGDRRLPARLDARLARAQPDGRQRGPPRRPLRRAGAGRGGAGAAAAGLSLVPGPLHGRRPLLAGDRERQPDRPQRRRPLDRAQLLPAGGALAARPRRGGGAGRGPADGEPLGVRLPRPAVRAGARLAAPARHHPRRHLLRRRQPLTGRDLPRLAAPERDPLRGPARRPARLLLGRRAPADPQRALLPGPALELRPLADLRGARPRAAGRAAGRGRGAASAGSAARASASTSAAPATSSSASTSPPTGRSPAAPAACSAAATGPSPAPRTPASSASPPTSPSAAPGMPSPAPARPAEPDDC